MEHTVFLPLYLKSCCLVTSDYGAVCGHIPTILLETQHCAGVYVSLCNLSENICLGLTLCHMH